MATKIELSAEEQDSSDKTLKNQSKLGNESSIICLNEIKSLEVRKPRRINNRSFNLPNKLKLLDYKTLIKTQRRSKKFLFYFRPRNITINFDKE